MINHITGIWLAHTKKEAPWPSGWSRWLRITCPSTLLVQIQPGTLDFSCEKDIQLTCRTSVVLFRCQLVPEIMYGGAPNYIVKSNKIPMLTTPNRFLHIWELHENNVNWLNTSVLFSETCQKRKFTATKQEKYYFYFDSQLAGLIQNEQNTAISSIRLFLKAAIYTRTTSGTLFSADV